MEKPSLRVVIAGDGAAEIVTLLRGRLAELAGTMPRRLHVEHGVAAVESDDVYIYRSSAHDTPAFAVEKVLDALAERGWVHLDTGALSPEEESQIHARLQELGYMD